VCGVGGRGTSEALCVCVCARACVYCTRGHISFAFHGSPGALRCAPSPPHTLLHAHADTPMHTQQGARARLGSHTHTHTHTSRCVFAKRLAIPSDGRSCLRPVRPGQPGSLPPKAAGIGCLRGRGHCASRKAGTAQGERPSPQSTSTHPKCCPAAPPASGSPGLPPWSSRVLRGHLCPRLHICWGSGGSRPPGQTPGRMRTVCWALPVGNRELPWAHDAGAPVCVITCGRFTAGHLCVLGSASPCPGGTWGPPCSLRLAPQRRPSPSRPRLQRAQPLRTQAAKTNQKAAPVPEAPFSQGPGELANPGCLSCPLT